MTMPNFFVIGAQKSGTTSLYHYLKQHPQVYMSPVKEPFFFDHKLDTSGRVVREEWGDPGGRHACAFSGIDEYRELFRGVGDEEAIGEASPLYIYAPGTAERLNKYAPKARMIALLRDPADRAYSAFMHAVRIGVEPLNDFARALEEEEDRVRNNWHYVFHYRRRGFYADQLKPYYRLFGPENVGVWLYEDLRDDPAGTTRGIFRFLGVDESFAPNTASRHNPAGVPGSKASRTGLRTLEVAVGRLKRFIPPTSAIYPLASRMRRGVQRRALVKPPPVDPGVRRRLQAEFREDVLKLQGLISRDLSRWLEDGEMRGRPERPDDSRASNPAR